MGFSSVFDVEEKVVGKKGIGAACPYCGGPVLAWDMDFQCSFCFIPISHKPKTKLYCALCSRRLLPSPNSHFPSAPPSCS